MAHAIRNALFQISLGRPAKKETLRPRTAGAASDRCCWPIPAASFAASLSLAQPLPFFSGRRFAGAVQVKRLCRLDWSMRRVCFSRRPHYQRCAAEAERPFPTPPIATNRRGDRRSWRRSRPRPTVSSTTPRAPRSMAGLAFKSAPFSRGRVHARGTRSGSGLKVHCAPPGWASARMEIKVTVRDV